MMSLSRRRQKILKMALMAGGEKEKTDLLPLFREVCDAFKAPNGKSLRISYFPLDEHLEVMGDRAQLAYMLKILLTRLVSHLRTVR